MRGRKPEPDGKRVTICAKFSEAEALAIDAARGDATRSAWLRSLVGEALAPSVTVEATTQPADTINVTLPDGTSVAGAFTEMARQLQGAAELVPKRRNCKHPGVRGKGVCPDCHEWVASK